jgi:hypothetical protein
MQDSVKVLQRLNYVELLHLAKKVLYAGYCSSIYRAKVQLRMKLQVCPQNLYMWFTNDARVLSSIFIILAVESCEYLLLALFDSCLHPPV